MNLNLVRRFFKFTVPSIVSMWIFSLYSLVDGMFVAWGVGEHALTAVNLSLPFVSLVFTLGILLATGTSTVTTFVESSAGVAEGGRTGLASMATAVMFFIAMFLSPVAQLIPTYACAAALIYVGVLMMSNVRNIDWDDPAAAVTGFVTVAFMPLTYNISYGIAFGLISYVFVKIFTGKIKDINVGTWIISILFALMFFLTR